MLAGRWHERPPLKSAGFGMSRRRLCLYLHQIHGRGHGSCWPIAADRRRPLFGR